MPRYSRQYILPEIGKAGQERISKATVAVVGLGALGSAALQVLARAGVGNLLLVDHDKVEEHNLQRQTLYSAKEVGKLKTKSAKENISLINPSIRIVAKEGIIDNQNIASFLGSSEIVIGCTDNTDSRFIMNKYCLEKNVPFIHGGAVGIQGNLFVSNVSGGPCFECIFKRGKSVLDTAETVGIFNPLPIIIGSMQAAQALKLILGEEPEEDLVYYDSWKNQLTRIKVKKNPTCPACSKKN